MNKTKIITITLGEFMHASAGELAKMTIEKPHTILISDVLADLTARIAHNLFDDKEDNK